MPRRVSGVHGRSVHMQDEVTAAASVLFDQYCAARTFAAITSTFQQMCDVLELKPSDHHNFYHHLKARLTTWKAQSLWAKLDKRATQREYKKGKACANTRVSRRFLFTVVRTPQKYYLCGKKMVSQCIPTCYEIWEQMQNNFSTN